MNDDLNLPLTQGDPPDPAVLQRISAQLAASSSSAVRPLPSNAVLLTVSLSIFAIVSLAIGALVKFYALAALSAGEIAVYYGVVAVLAVLFARAVIERMIPGERRLLPSPGLWMTALFVLAVLMALLFADFGTAHFVTSGIPCLRLGAISALVSGGIGWRFLRRGYLVSPGETILLYSFFAGLVGVAVLALHCPIRNSLHLLVWHLGAMILAGVTGLFIGKYFENADR
jgi:hypothetical protein